MNAFQALPPGKREYMELLFRDCTEEVKYYMSLVDIEAGRTFIKAGTDCTHIIVVLSGTVAPAAEKTPGRADEGEKDGIGSAAAAS